MNASVNGHAAVVELLLEADADVDTVNLVSLALHQAHTRACKVMMYRY